MKKITVLLAVLFVCIAFSEIDVHAYVDPPIPDGNPYQFCVKESMGNPLYPNKWRIRWFFSSTPFRFMDTDNPNRILVTPMTQFVMWSTDEGLETTWEGPSSESAPSEIFLNVTQLLYTTHPVRTESGRTIDVYKPPEKIDLMSPKNGETYTDYPPIIFGALTTSITAASFELYYNGEKYYSDLVNLQGAYVNRLPATIPYKGSGTYKIEIWDPMRMEKFKEASFTLNVPQTSTNFAYIQGIQDGGNYFGYRDLIVQIGGYDNVKFTMNGQVISSVLNPGTHVYRYDRLPYKLGTNVITLENGSTVLQTYTITITREQPDNGQGGGIPDYGSLAPDRSDYPDGIFGSLEYGFDTLVYYIKYPFVKVGESIAKLITIIQDQFSWVANFSRFIGSLFSFLPEEIRTLMTVVLMSTLIIALVKVVRG